MEYACHIHLFLSKKNENCDCSELRRPFNCLYKNFNYRGGMSIFLFIQKEENIPEKKVTEIIHEGIQTGLKIGWNGYSNKKINAKSNLITFYDSTENDFLTSDIRTNSFLIISGVWFYKNDFSIGCEKKLLNECIKNGIEYVSNNIDGFFSLLFFDAINSNFYVVTDIIGSQYLFYRKFNGVLLLSNSSLILGSFKPINIDIFSCREFVNLGIIYDSRTLFKNVERFDFSSIYLIKHNKFVTKTKYWSLSNINEQKINMEDALNKFSNNLLDSVTKITNFFKNPICDLTGGYDSRIILTGFLMANCFPDTVVAGKENSVDCQISAELSKYYNLKNIQIFPKNEMNISALYKMLKYTDGEFNSFEYLNIYNVHKIISKDYDISINGSFGEIAKGNWWELINSNFDLNNDVCVDYLIKKRFLFQKYPDFYDEKDYSDMAEKMTLSIRDILGSIKNKNNYFKMDVIYLYMRMRCWQGRIASSTNKIWPCLSPFMFRDNINTILSVDHKIRNKMKFTKEFLIKYNHEWANHRTDKGGMAAKMSLNNIHKHYRLPIYYMKKLYEKYNQKLPYTNNKISQSEIDLRNFIFSKIDFMKYADIGYINTSNNYNILEKELSSNVTKYNYNKVILQRLISLDTALKLIL